MGHHLAHHIHKRFDGDVHTNFGNLFAFSGVEIQILWISEHNIQIYFENEHRDRCCSDKIEISSPPHGLKAGFQEG